MLPNEKRIIKTAIGIRLIKDAGEQTNSSQQQVDSCINKLCSLISYDANFTSDEFVEFLADANHVSDHFKQEFVDSEGFKIISNDIMKTILWLDLLPGYIE